jgi:hypothetical protein
LPFDDDGNWLTESYERALIGVTAVPRPTLVWNWVSWSRADQYPRYRLGLA